jgi:hypothetical protein
MNTGAHPLRAGFNQSGGAYFMTLAALEPTPGTLATTYVNTLLSAGSNSGGAFVGPTLAQTLMSNVLGTGIATHAAAAALVGANTVLKDMGKTVVSSGRVFRKFAPVARNTSNGVVGGAAVAPNAGYGSFYLEVGMGAPATVGGNPVPAPIARYA